MVHLFDGNRFRRLMAIRLSVSYYYVTPEDLDKLMAFKEVSGDTEKILVTQFIRGWIGRNRDYYMALARTDAMARGLTLKGWGEVILDGGISALPDYREQLKEIPPDPLAHITLPRTAQKSSLNYILLGKQNVALLRIGAHHARDTLIGFISRIVHEQLQRNWDKLYAPQVEMDNLDNWK